MIGLITKTYLLFFFFLKIKTRVDQIVGKGPKVDGDTTDDQSMMGRLVKVEKQVGIFHLGYQQG